MWSTTRKLLDLGSPGYRGEWHAFRQYFTNVSPRAKDELFVWFERDLLPGYVWAFPLADGTANVGFGIRRGHGIGVQEMKALWTDLLAAPPHRRGARVPMRSLWIATLAWPIPARLGRLPVRNGRVMFVGDAAAATDPMTGEGIGQAIETGIWAAEAIHAHGEDVDAVGRSYDERLRRNMQKDHRLAGRLSWPPGPSSPGRSGAPYRRSIELDTPQLRAVALRGLPEGGAPHPQRWHTRLFSQPGALHRHRRGRDTPQACADPRRERIQDLAGRRRNSTWPQ